MASYHLSVQTIKRSAGRSATAPAAFGFGERFRTMVTGTETASWFHRLGQKAASMTSATPAWENAAE